MELDPFSSYGDHDFLLNTVFHVHAKTISSIRELGRGLPEAASQLEYIQHMLLLISALIKDGQLTNHMRLQEVWISQFVNFSYGLEDCIDHFKMVAVHEHQGPSFRWPFHTEKRMLTTAQFAWEVDILWEKLKHYTEQVGSACHMIASLPTASPATASSSVPIASYIPHPQGDPLGLFEKCKKKICDWVREEKEQPLMVISIVGFLGSGKTTLAKMVYHNKKKEYLRIFVLASEFSDEMELLTKIYQKAFKVNSPSDQDKNQLIKILKEELTKKRYVMVVDDVRTLKTWHIIQNIILFHGTSGLIIVTTRINSIAEVCCSRDCYVHRMQALDKGQSKKLLENKGIYQYDADFHIISESIVNKCDGLPLALVGVKEYLEESSGKSLLAMKEGLADWYSGLKITHKTLLLTLSMYPVGRTVRKISLFRRLFSEGLESVGFTDEECVAKYFMELVDWNLIQPVDISDSGEVKTCRLHGVLHDFIVKKSVDENFVTLIHNDKLLWNGSEAAVRRLSVHKTSHRSKRTAMDIDLSCLRTLVMSKHEGDPIVDFRKCILLRVLDLEDCPWLDNKILKMVSQLHCLKMLVIRDEKEDVLLPMEILTLPQLTCLLGRFRLQCGRTLSKKICALLNKSRLKTLAGIVLDKSSGIEHILSATMHLSKIKLWAQNRSDYLTQILARLVYHQLNWPDRVLSVSIDFGKDTQGFRPLNVSQGALNVSQGVNSSQGVGVYSVKLRGTTIGLHGFLHSLAFVRNLCLFSNGLRSEVLSALQTLLPLLEHLKLADDEDCSIFCDGSVQFQARGFPILHCLWIETKKLPEISIEEGSMFHLRSLKLLCDDVSGLPADTITRLTNLSEVTLGDKVVPKIRKKWEDVAGSHQNRPSIKTSLARKSGDKQGKS